MLLARMLAPLKPARHVFVHAEFRCRRRSHCASVSACDPPIRPIKTLWRSNAAPRWPSVLLNSAFMLPSLVAVGWLCKDKKIAE